MEFQEFISNVADQFEDTDRSVFTADTKFMELDEWTSLIALSIISMIDEEYDVAIKGSDVKGISTLGELFELVKSKMD